MRGFTVYIFLRLVSLNEMEKMPFGEIPHINMTDLHAAELAEVVTVERYMSRGWG